MNEHDLVRRYPRLFHMATAGSWNSIREHGLLTTEQIIAGSALPAATRHALLTERRATSVEVQHPELGRVTIRDQAPLRMANLHDALTDMDATQWLQTLNNRVFFWLHPNRLNTLLNARLYRTREQDVITINTASLLSRHQDRVRLSGINSGSTLWPGAPSRGRDTFQPVEQYPFDDRRRGRTDVTAVAELAVIDGVPDLAEHVISVDRWRGPDLLHHLGP